MIQTSFNFGNIDSKAAYTGGLAGMMTAIQAAHRTFLSCGNYGNISTSGKYAGGLAGSIEKSFDWNIKYGIGSFDYCYNCGNIKSTNKEAVISGILGQTVDYSFTIMNCYNSGILEAKYPEDAIVAQIVLMMTYPDDAYQCNNYCIAEGNEHSFACWPDDYLNVQYYGVKGSRYADGFTLEEMINGTLCDTLNENGEVYSQVNGRPATTDSVRPGDENKGLVQINGEYYEFDGNGKYIGKAKIPDKRFDDVKDADYFFKPVLWAIWKGITAGTAENAFSPNGKCTRAQIVTMLWRAAGSPEPETKDNPFGDVKADDYFYKPVLWAVENGITSGTAKGVFSPHAVCTRAQAVTFLWVCNDRTVPENKNIAFSDVIGDDYYFTAVLWAVEKGVTAGTGPSTFSPNADCTRGQIVTFLYKANY